ncbi:MAG TPA: class I SAM-dependent methyltransferase [Acidobacteriota bacterium]|nr:class I SAM-dependent methyltransferase [Acidobacteriota bacterium]
MVDFDKHLGRGERAYNTKVGDWWRQKSEDRAHRNAYRTIAQTVRRYFRREKRKPKFIVDYASGNAMVLRELVKLFPQTRFIALDGSHKMLSIAKGILTESGIEADWVEPEQAFSAEGPQIRLVCTPLPENKTPSSKADAVLFLFPNLNSSKKGFELIREKWKRDKAAETGARLFSKLQDENAKKQPDPDSIYEELVLAAAVAENIRRLLKRNLYWFKADYSNAARLELQNADQWQLLFSERAMDFQIGDQKQKSIFQLVENRYYQSAVILDVFEQTRDPSDKRGGYMITVFRSK